MFPGPCGEATPRPGRHAGDAGGGAAHLHVPEPHPLPRDPAQRAGLGPPPPPRPLARCHKRKVTGVGPWAEPVRPPTRAVSQLPWGFWRFRWRGHGLGGSRLGLRAGPGLTSARLLPPPPAPAAPPSRPSPQRAGCRL